MFNLIVKNYSRSFSLLIVLSLISACRTGSQPMSSGNMATSESNQSIVCTLTPEQLSARRDALLHGLLKDVDERTPLEHGYCLKFMPPHRHGLLDEIARIVEQERRCCAFLRFQITVEPDGGPIVLEITGPAGTREFLDAL